MLRVEQSRQEAQPPALSEHLEYCQEAFAAAKAAGAKLVRLSIAVPLAPLLAQPHGSMLWCPPMGAQMVGSGEAASVTGTGPERFSQIKESATELWLSLHDAPQARATPLAPRLFGGLSFAAAPVQEPWSAFGQGRFWLPRKLYTRLRGAACLSLCAQVSESPSDVAAELRSEQERLSLTSESAPQQAQIDSAQHLPAPEWSARVEAIVSAINRGSLCKVVAARHSTLHFRDGIELRPALERLTERYPDCYRYAYQQGVATFLGASPETLVNKCGLRVETQALAGSIAAQLPDASAQLLASDKDRFEQDLVVRAITEALKPMCSELQASDTPTTRTLRHLTHLCTPIEGFLNSNRHVLDLVQALHPTPAVGGSPVGKAMQWIAENEEDRGWYAAPVGWFDASGDGHFAVAIRSALFTGNKAMVYAGAGIVADSNPQLEYQETALKQRAILDALGIL